MGVVAAIAAGASVAVAAGSAYMQHRDARSALAAQTQAANTANAQNQVSQQASIRNQIRQQRIRAAQIQQAASNTGTQFSSGDIGGVSALTSQIDSNVATVRQNAYTQNALTNLGNEAAEDQSNAATWGSVGSLAGQSFNLFANTTGAKTTFQNLFK